MDGDRPAKNAEQRKAEYDAACLAFHQARCRLQDAQITVARARRECERLEQEMEAGDGR